MKSTDLLGKEAKSFIEWYDIFKTEEGISLLNVYANKRGVSIDSVIVWMTDKAHSLYSRSITKKNRLQKAI